MAPLSKQDDAAAPNSRGQTFSRRWCYHPRSAREDKEQEQEPQQEQEQPRHDDHEDSNSRQQQQKRRQQPLTTEEQQKPPLSFLRASRKMISDVRRRGRNFCSSSSSSSTMKVAPHDQAELSLEAMEATAFENQPPPYTHPSLRRSKKHSSLMIIPSKDPAKSNNKTSSRRTTKTKTKTTKKGDQEQRGRLHETWYYSANHVLVNRERMMRGIPLLTRNVVFDEIAKTIATSSSQMVGHCNFNKANVLKNNNLLIPAAYHGNVLRGISIRQMHETTMAKKCDHQDNLLNGNYREFGMATHKGSDGFLYLCQLFDQTRLEI